eukprot:1616526-Rhodomonas_salina.1
MPTRVPSSSPPQPTTSTDRCGEVQSPVHALESPVLKAETQNPKACCSREVRGSGTRTSTTTRSI